jgi:acid phosphatase (class A)
MHLNPAARIVVLLLGLWCLAEAHGAAHYVAPADLDLAPLLAPPPAAGSAAAERDLAAVLEVQRTRTPDQVVAARADVELDPFRYADVLGPAFNPARLPRTAAYLQAVTADAKALYEGPKQHFGRPRPFAVSAEVQPVIDKPRSASYPSGHATLGYLWAILLADLVPEKSAVLFDRGRAYGWNRVVGGVHFPTDDDAGQMAAVAIAARMMALPAWRADRDAARAELRAALGL